MVVFTTYSNLTAASFVEADPNNWGACWRTPTHFSNWLISELRPLAKMFPANKPWPMTIIKKPVLLKVRATATAKQKLRVNKIRVVKFYSMALKYATTEYSKGKKLAKNVEEETKKNSMVLVQLTGPLPGMLTSNSL